MDNLSTNNKHFHNENQPCLFVFKSIILLLYNNSVWEFIYPKTCLVCGFIGTYLCPSCSNKLIYLDIPICIYCRKPSILGLTHPQCQVKYGVDGVLSIFHYNPPLKKIIKSIKYRLVKESLHEVLFSIHPNAMMPFHQLVKIYPSSVFNAVPLHPLRYKQRGFNQAEEISQFFSQFFTLPQAQSLVRSLHTSPQAQLKQKSERVSNVKGAFQCNDALLKTYILIDDVITSGSTVKEAAQVLKQQGVKKVFAFSLAHG